MPGSVAHRFVNPMRRVRARRRHGSGRMTGCSRSLGAGAAMLAALAGCTHTGPAYGPAPADATVVTMTNTFAFSPELVRIAKGGTVEWRNTSFDTHTVTDAPGSAKGHQGMALPEGAAAFDSGKVAPGQIYRVTFTTPGVYNYICMPHYDIFGMAGAVVVTP